VSLKGLKDLEEAGEGFGDDVESGMERRVWKLNFTSHVSMHVIYLSIVY